MADDLTKHIVLKVTADDSGVDDLKNKLHDVNNTPIDTPFKNLRIQLREANSEAEKMAEQFGKNSQQFTDAAQKVANLKDEFTKYKATVEAFNPDNKLQAVVGVARGAVNAVEGVSGAMEFLGVKSDTALETIAKLQGLMAFSDALSSVDNIKNSFSAFSSVIKSSSAYMAINNGLTSAATAIMKLFGIAVDTTSVSFKVLKGAIAATGIGLLVVAIGELIAHWDDVKKAISGVTDEQEALNKTTKDYIDAATTATQKVNEVRVAFELAEKGVVSKKAALQKYNDTLGDAFGKTNDLTKAENLLNSKADTYIKVMGLKAQANALFTLSAKEAAKGILANSEDQTSWVDKLVASAKGAITGIAGAAESLGKAQEEGVKQAQKDAKANSESLTKSGEDLLKQAGEISKKAGLNIDILDNKTTDTEKKNTIDLQKDYLQQEQNLKQHLATIQKMEDDSARAIAESKMNDRNKELTELDAKYQDQKNALQKETDDSIKILNDELKKKEITQKQYDDKKVNILKLQSDTEKLLATQNGEDKLAIAIKYDKLATDLIQSYNQNAFEKKKADLIKSFDDVIKNLDTVADAARIAQLQKLKQQQVDDLTKQDALQNYDNASSAINDATAISDTDTKDDLAKKQSDSAKQKDQAFLDQLKRLGTNYDAIKALNKKHNEDMLADNKAFAAADKKIDEEKLQAKYAMEDELASIASSASDLAGQNTLTGKLLAIASTTISTYAAAQKAYESQFAALNPASPFLATAAMVAAIASGLANVKRIIDVKVPTKNGDVSGAGGTAPQITAPTITQTVLPPDIADKVQDVRVINQNQTPIRAYITDQDLKDSQTKQDFFNKLSSI